MKGADAPFSSFTGRSAGRPEAADEWREPAFETLAPPLTCLPASSPRERGEETLPLAAVPFLAFARLLRGFGFGVAPEQATRFMQAVTLLGPRSMDDIFQAAVATLAPSPERRAEFEALFRGHFHGDGSVSAEGDGEEETAVKDDFGASEQTVEAHREEKGGELSSAIEQLSARHFERDDDRLAEFRRKLPAALPFRRSFRRVSTPSRGAVDLRRSLREIARADGDVPTPLLRRRQHVPRKLLVLIDISGSMKLHTADYLKLAHAIVQAADHAEIFTFGTRLTRITTPLRVRDREQALASASALVEDWDGGTRIGPTLLAFLAVPRFAAFARGATVLILSDGLERGGHAEIETAMRRLSARAHRVSLCTPLAADPRFRPETAALKAILPMLDDLVDGSSIAGLTEFILSLARPAPRAEQLWKRAS